MFAAVTYAAFFLDQVFWYPYILVLYFMLSIHLKPEVCLIGFFFHCFM